MRRHTLFEHFSKCTNHLLTSYVLLLLRMVFGIMFLFAGLSKFNGWSAENFLNGATGPFAEWFQSMAGSGLVDALNIWGLTLIGVCLILGIFIRPASFFGVIMLFLYYIANFTNNISYGLIDEHIIYMVIFLLFLSGGIGHIFGLDGLISRNLRENNMYSKIFFG